MFCLKKDVLASLVDCFMSVDDRVALTHTLKSAAREIGLRGRAVRLSPSAVRRMVLRGSRSDPGYAAAGAPSALIDAISDLFMIPYRDTRVIAAEFLAGHVTRATQKFLVQIRTETIRRLEMERAVIGTSLLEQIAVDLLTDGTETFSLQRQPFQSQGIAFYGTATDLNNESTVMLGGDELHSGAPYDFVEAALASSAFPAIFAPRAESQVFPGTGRSDLYFADGGMFDNLPFIPAIEILSCAQRGYRRTSGAALTVGQFLRARLEKPDLIIAGALNALPEQDEEGMTSCETLAAIYRRAGSLEHNVKIRAFEYTSQRIYSQLQAYSRANSAEEPATAPHFLDGIVNAGVLPVFPASRDHLNKTFAFCASVGLKPNRVAKSIADGCYQTLAAFATEYRKARESAKDLAHDPRLLCAKSVNGLMQDGRVPQIEQYDQPGCAHTVCPFFLKDRKAFRCVFAKTKKDRFGTEMNSVVHACRKDPAHLKHLYA
jgi:hypothetical protein